MLPEAGVIRKKDGDRANDDRQPSKCVPVIFLRLPAGISSDRPVGC